MYTVFVKAWWKEETDRYGMKRLVPNSRGRRTILGHASTIKQAQDMCREYNKSHKPGKLSRKAEFTSDF